MKQPVLLTMDRASETHPDGDCLRDMGVTTNGRRGMLHQK